MDGRETMILGMRGRIMRRRQVSAILGRLEGKWMRQVPSLPKQAAAGNIPIAISNRVDVLRPKYPLTRKPFPNFDRLSLALARPPRNRSISLLLHDSD